LSTVAQFQTSVTRRTGNDDTTACLEYLNEGYADVLLRTRCKVSSTTLSLVAGTADYTIPTATVLEVTEVAKIVSGSLDYRAQRVTPEEILRLRANCDSTDPVTRYAVDGMTLMLWPTPASADVLHYYYVPRPTALAVAGDIPSDIPTQWHKALFWYACAEMSDDRDDESSGQGELYRAKYEQMIVRIRKNMRRMGGRRLPRAKVGPRRLAPHDNSADW
jgi:hypothetical protein